MFVSFLSKNENDNGFDTIGLNSSLFDYRRVVFFFILLLYLALFCLVACFRLDEMFAYRAPSSGEIWNFLRVFNMRGRLYYG